MIPIRWEREHKQMNTFGGVVFEFNIELIDCMEFSFSPHNIGRM